MTTVEKWLVPGLVLAIALVQSTLVLTQELSPWKGGGFGMFSTVDSPSMRFVVASGKDESGDRKSIDAFAGLDRDFRKSAQALSSPQSLEKLEAYLKQGSFITIESGDHDLRPARSTDAKDGRIHLTEIESEWWRLVYSPIYNRVSSAPLR